MPAMFNLKQFCLCISYKKNGVSCADVERIISNKMYLLENFIIINITYIISSQNGASIRSI